MQRFAYALSHGLKGPLRTVNIFTERLQKMTDGKLDEDGLLFMRFVIDGARQAQKMIDGLLEYSVATHQRSIDGSADLQAVLADAISDVRVMVEECGARITAGQLPTVRADAERIRRVFLNLLSNALKYRANRTPEIHVAAQNQGSEWLISVKDNGLGIEARHSDTIFGLFERLHTVNEYEGSGVGLALCRAIIQRHRGRIWVESELGQGSTFFFTLPVQETDLPPGVEGRAVLGTIGIPLEPPIH